MIPSGMNVKGLNTLSEYRRATRAREPNGDPELCTDCWHPGMKGWHKDLTCVGKAQVVYKDLRDCDNKGLLPDKTPCKNDSAMWDTYNTYSNGHGGCCAVWSGDQSPYGPMGSYFCGNSSAGGWVGYDDPRTNSSQGLSPALPVGFDYDGTQYPKLAGMTDPSGAILHVWRAQGWFVNMFEIASHDQGSQAMTFAQINGHVKGGWQGGRGWQVNKANINSTNGDYLLAGKWMVENHLSLLDSPNEYYFDPTQRKLSLWPNSTNEAQNGPNASNYVAVQLDTLFSLNGTNTSSIEDVKISGVHFRDAADITMKPWGVPSGGDWGLYRGGAIFLEGTKNVEISGCDFERLDGNAIMVSGFNRNATISDNHFSWLGASAIAGWGYTNENDGMDGLQPRFTRIMRNYVREIGIIEKQSSAWFQAKTCQSIVENNIIFNGPRAGINLNDGFGGSTNISKNLIFNECRETGDHGPINSWDRTAYISDVATGKPSYTAAMNHVRQNFIIANYGSSQGFDTDDGSSWYNISSNFFFQADAVKMDYGGHDSVFSNNVIYVRDSDGQNCINTGAYLAGHGMEYSGNKCILPFSKNIGHVAGCDCINSSSLSNKQSGSRDDPGPREECGVYFHDNEYFGIDQNLTMTCSNPPLSFQQWQADGQDVNSKEWAIPTDDQLIYWARERLGMSTPGPAPPPPKPLPPAPTPHWPNTCEGRCGKAGHCCVGLVSGCSSPNCDMGCVIANASTTLQDCVATCNKAHGKCDFTVGKTNFQMCQRCPNVDGCGGCDTSSACEDGCKFAFQNKTNKAFF
eukprot:m.196382 g.196382  ORF g.196382 m.196382 type:complete len:799 (+) comp15699_c0_seq3:667-3063(+)